MKAVACLLVLCLLLSSLTGCRAQDSFSESFLFMDTVIGITLYTEDADLAERAFDTCHALLSELDALWSRHKDGSDVARWNASADGRTVLDVRTAELIQTAMELAQHTSGAFDPTLAPLSDLWTTCGALDRLPTDRELSQALMKTGYEGLVYEGDLLLKSTAGQAIDLGGIGKGAATDALLAYLTSLQLDGGLITFGSNVAVFGGKPDGSDFRVAIRSPRDAEEWAGILRMQEGEILSVSGDYERYVTIGGQRYHHILDRQTGYPAASGLSSVAVLCADGALADALSTALLVMGEQKAMELYRGGFFSFEAVLITSEGEILLTDGLSERFSR